MSRFVRRCVTPDPPFSVPEPRGREMAMEGSRVARADRRGKDVGRTCGASTGAEA